MLAIAADKLKVAKMAEFVPDRVENNVVGKGEMLQGSQHFFLFPHCFQMASFSWLLNPRTADRTKQDQPKHVFSLILL